MLQTFKRMRNAVSQDYPLTVYYAYKQTENEEAESTANTEISSSGWETMLQALIKAGFSITGTWPLRTERPGRTQDIASNALASSIAIVCRPRADDAAASSRRAFLAELREALKTGLHDLQSGNIAPVDLAQASIGPGIAVYSKYKEVLEADGSPLTVRQALVLINKELDVLLGEQTGGLDGESQFCISWFEQYGFQEGPYGDANTLMRARMADEQKLKDSKVVQAVRGKVRLARHGEFDFGVLLKTENNRNMVWAVVQHLCRALADAGGLEQCVALMAKLSSETTERVKVLAYRIYQICDRKGWAEDALAYNNLVATWGILETKAREASVPKYIEVDFPTLDTTQKV
jgi:putative DNA methylase